jgi:hypothetical protein
MERRNFIQALAAGAAAGGIAAAQSAAAATTAATGASGADARAQLAALAQKMSEPVLTNMAAGTLKKTSPSKSAPPGMAATKAWPTSNASAA